MYCNHCHSTMQKTDSIAEGRAQQTWFECPVCAATQTISEPYEQRLKRIGTALRCSCAWPDTDHALGT